jgi:hypothetical protein
MGSSGRSEEAVPMGNEAVWQAIMGRHADNLRGFYGQLLAGRAGGNEPAAVGEGAPPTYGAEGSSGEPTPVRDLDAALAFAERLGGRVCGPRATTGGERMAVVLSPGGVRVALRSAV